MATVLSLRGLKPLLCIVKPAPPALSGGPAPARRNLRREVLVPRLRGCPTAAGLADAAGRVCESAAPSG